VEPLVVAAQLAEEVPLLVGEVTLYEEFAVK